MKKYKGDLGDSEYIRYEESKTEIEADTKRIEAQIQRDRENNAVGLQHSRIWAIVVGLVVCCVCITIIAYKSVCVGAAC